MNTIVKSFKVPFLNFKVPVSYNPTNFGSEGLSEKILFGFAPFKNWVEALEHSVSSANNNNNKNNGSKPYDLRGIHIQSVDQFGTGKIGFLKLKADLIHPNGRPLPGVTVLRGGSVAMLVILQETDTEDHKEHIVLVDQPRVPAGTTSFLEIPAGMIDEEIGSSSPNNRDQIFLGAAAKEMEEEIGITIRSMDDLVDLTGGKELYLSPGLLDETMRFFLHKVQLTRKEIEKMQGSLRERTDNGENEVITIRIVPKEDIYTAGIRDAKTFLALGLYAQHQGFRPS